MSAVWGCTTSKVRSSLCIFRINPRRCLRFISCYATTCFLAFFPVVRVSCSLCEFNVARSAKLTQSLQWGRAFVFSGQSRHHLHNRQHRSHAKIREETLQRICGLSAKPVV